MTAFHAAAHVKLSRDQAASAIPDSEAPHRRPGDFVPDGLHTDHESRTRLSDPRFGPAFRASAVAERFPFPDGSGQHARRQLPGTVGESGRRAAIDRRARQFHHFGRAMARCGDHGGTHRPRAPKCGRPERLASARDGRILTNYWPNLSRGTSLEPETVIRSTPIGYTARFGREHGGIICP